MRVRDLPLDPRVTQSLEADGFDELWPSQEEAAPVAAKGGNLLLAVPTASGKSLVAYLALLQTVAKGGKGLYIVPLRALAGEKYEDLKRLGERMGARVAMSIGDLDSPDKYLKDADVIVATSEKADALMRHRASWLTRLQCIVADEVHLLHDPDRGPTLEVLLTHFKRQNPSAQLIALSATVSNSEAVARWLDATHVATTWRPVTLHEGVLHEGTVYYTDNEREEVRSSLKDAALALAEDAVADGGQTLVFVNTRKSTEATAEKLAKALRDHLAPETQALLAEAASNLAGGSDGTSVEKRLARCVAGGAAFHHAGLTNQERRLVEDLFKQGHLKALAATPTLAAGINLPARRVVVRDLWRYDGNAGGNVPLPVLEYKQMAGRAGRPKYDKEGTAICIARNENARTDILVDYLLADPEPVTSKLGNESALRTHLLAAVASGFVRTEEGLREFVGHTFFAHEADAWHLDEGVTRVVDFLVEHGFLRAKDTDEGRRVAATEYGRRVSELYVDPLSAMKLREALGRAKEKALTPLGALHAVCATPNMINLFPRRGDDWLESEAMERAEELLFPLPEGLDYEYFLAELKTARLLLDWADEVNEEVIVNRYNVYPGDIRNKVDAAVWLLHAMREIDRLFDRAATRDLARLHTRVRHGVRDELLPLVRLRGVGRVRARNLWVRGYKTRAALKRASLVELEGVPTVGPQLARQIKRELEEDRGDDEDEGEVASDVEPPMDASPSADGPEQRGLWSFE